MCVSCDCHIINLVCPVTPVCLQEGLPIKITENCPPSETGPIPLFPVSLLPSSRPALLQGNGIFPALFLCITCLFSHTENDLENDTGEDSPIIAMLMEAGVKRINLKKEIRFIKLLGSVSHVGWWREEMSRPY